MTARLSQSGRSLMLNRGRQLFTKYRHTMHRNILDPKDYYWFGWSSEERKAMEMLAQKNALKYCNRLVVECPSLAGKRDFLGKKPSVTLAFGHSYDSWPYPEKCIKDTDITDPTLRSKLLTWVVRDAQLRYWQRRFDKYANALVWGGGQIAEANGDILSVTPVNTPGQLYRAWPEFASLVEKRYVDRMAGQKLKSAMPQDWKGDTLERFRSLPLMDEINSILLTCGVMEDDMKQDRLYPN